MTIGETINTAVASYYGRGPRNEPGPAGEIIAALGWSGYWISEDVTPISNKSVRTLQSLCAEIGKIDLRTWAGSDVLRHKQVDEIDRLRRDAARIVTSSHLSEERSPTK